MNNPIGKFHIVMNVNGSEVTTFRLFLYIFLFADKYIWV
jgi:hypothetical protein